MPFAICLFFFFNLFFIIAATFCPF
jgi:hypothetical protein